MGEREDTVNILGKYRVQEQLIKRVTSREARGFGELKNHWLITIARATLKNIKRKNHIVKNKYQLQV